MAVKDLFSKDTKYISRKNMRQNYRHDPAFKEIMSDPAMAKILDQPVEQKKFHDRLMEAAKDGKLDPHDMRKIAYEAAHGEVKDISSAEGRSIARAFFPDSSRRYEYNKSETKQNPNDTSSPKSSRSELLNAPIKKSNRVSPAFFTYKARSTHVSVDPKKPGKEKPSFFDSMRSVSRNKHS